MRRGTARAYKGCRAATGLKRDDCGRSAFAERRAAERGALRAMFLMANMMDEEYVPMEK